VSATFVEASAAPSSSVPELTLERQVLSTIRHAGENCHPTAVWMQQLAAHALDPVKWGHPGQEPPRQPAMSRADGLRALITSLQEHGHDCIDGGPHEFEAAQLLIAAAQHINAAIDSLENVGTADDAIPPRAPRAGE